MMLYVFLISLAVFVYALVTLFLNRVFRKKLRITERLIGIKNMESDEDAALLEEKSMKKGWIRIPKYFVPEGLKSAIRLSGLAIRVDDFVFLWIFIVLVPPSFLYMVLGKTVLSILTAVVLALAPVILLKVLGNNQKKEFEKQLGDALTIISNALRAGHSLPQALVSVTETLPDPINREFLTASREIRLGSTVTEALRGVAGRMESKDLGLLITAVEVQQRVGGNLSEIMDTISKTIRDRMTLKRNVGSMTAQGKISGIVVGLLPVILLVVVSVLTPGYMDPLFETTIGKVILLVCVIMEGVGYMIIMKTVNVKL